MTPRRRDPEEDRRRLFKRMEWVFVYAPPMLAAFIGIFGGAFLAWLFRIQGTTFAQRWIGAVVLLLVLPGAIYAIRYWWTERK